MTSFDCNDYQQLALRTAVLDRPRADQIMNAVLGFGGESGEIAESLVFAVSGDTSPESLDVYCLTLMAIVGMITDNVKKFLYHNHPLKVDAIVDSLATIGQVAAMFENYVLSDDPDFSQPVLIRDSSYLKVIPEEAGDLQWYIAQLCYGLDVNLSDVQRDNIAKLAARYGEKFSSEKSLNRER